MARAVRYAETLPPVAHAKNSMPADCLATRWAQTSDAHHDPSSTLAIRIQRDAMTTRTAEEAKANYIEKMGEPLGTQFQALLHKLAWLHGVWGEFVELFRGEARVKVLNQTAPAMFRIFFDSLWQFILLDIARLTDPSKSAGKKKLTIRNLPQHVEPNVRANVKHLVDAALKKSEFCRDRRNRHIAHLDLDLPTNASAKPLDPATKKDVDEALAAIGSVLNEVSLHYMGSKLHFQPNVGGGGNALALLRRLGFED
jgi:AbiU2